jgi:malonate transporter
MLKVLANALTPIFAGLLLGYVAGLRKVVDNKNVKSLITFVMSFALPCSLFVTIARTPHHLLSSQGKFAIVLAVVYGIIFAVTFFASQSISKDSPGDSAVLALTLGFPNVAAVGLPLLQAVYGPQANIAVAVAVAVGSITISPLTLAILESGTVSGQALSMSSRIRHSALQAIKKPVFWAPMLGIFAVLIDLDLPTYLDHSLTIMGSATAGSALFLTGLVVSAQRFTLSQRVIWTVVLKNFLQPALCLGVAMVLGLPSDMTRYAVLMSAIPCGFFGIVFGKGFNVTPPIASSSLLATYLIGIFSLAGWILVLNHIH